MRVKRRGSIVAPSDVGGAYLTAKPRQHKMERPLSYTVVDFPCEQQRKWLT